MSILFLIAYLSFADLDERFSFNSFKEGFLGFFSGILNKVSIELIFGMGVYLDTLLFSDKFFKKYLTILSSNE